MRLLKSIYGLRQTSREWHSLFHTTLAALGLQRSTFDPNMYSMNHPVHGTCIVMACVDDIFAVSDSLDWVSVAKAHIRLQFNITYFGLATSIMSIDITRDLHASTFWLSQEQYTTKELLEKYGMLDNNPFTLPMFATHYRVLELEVQWLQG
jgi:hypothetical protein